MRHADSLEPYSLDRSTKGMTSATYLKLHLIQSDFFIPYELYYIIDFK